MQAMIDELAKQAAESLGQVSSKAVSYTHLRAHET